MEIGTEAAQFPEKEYINGIFVQCISWINNRQRRPMLLDVVGMVLPFHLLEIRKILRANSGCVGIVQGPAFNMIINIRNMYYNTAQLEALSTFKI